MNDLIRDHIIFSIVDYVCIFISIYKLYDQKDLGVSSRKNLKWSVTFTIKFTFSIFVSIIYSTYPIIFMHLFKYYAFFFWINSVTWIIAALTLYSEYRRQIPQKWFGLRSLWFLNGFICLFYTIYLGVKTEYSNLSYRAYFIINLLKTVVLLVLFFMSILSNKDYSLIIDLEKGLVLNGYIEEDLKNPSLVDSKHTYLNTNKPINNNNNIDKKTIISNINHLYLEDAKGDVSQFFHLISNVEVIFSFIKSKKYQYVEYPNSNSNDANIKNTFISNIERNKANLLMTMNVSIKCHQNDNEILKQYQRIMNIEQLFELKEIVFNSKALNISSQTDSEAFSKDKFDDDILFANDVEYKRNKSGKNRLNSIKANISSVINIIMKAFEDTSSNTISSEYNISNSDKKIPIKKSSAVNINNVNSNNKLLYENLEKLSSLFTKLLKSNTKLVKQLINYAELKQIFNENLSEIEQNQRDKVRFYYFRIQSLIILIF